MSLSITGVTWNIHKGIGGLDRRYRLDRIIELLAHYNPQLALLQEVDEGARRSSHERQIDVIGDALDLPYRCYGPTHRLRTEGHYGNAILSQWPLEDMHHLDLTIGWRKTRGALSALCRIAHGGQRHTVALCNLHLGLAGSIRRQQLERFLACPRTRELPPHVPIILGGDFNDLWGTLGPAILEPAGFRRAGKRTATFPAAAPLRPLDGIFLRGPIESERCYASRMKLARQASDHLPLIAQLSLTPEG